MKHVKGPDFPTGGYVIGRSGIRDAYRTGRGRIVMRARAHVEELRGGKSAVIVTELPYGVQEGRRERRHRQDRRPGPGQGPHRDLRPAGSLRPDGDADPDRAQAGCDRRTSPSTSSSSTRQLQTTFGYNAVALVDGVPRTLSLLELVQEYLRYQREVVDAPVEARAAQGRGARPRPPGLPDRPGQPRRGHRPHPRLGRYGRCALGPDGALRALGDPGPGDPRPPARPPHRARAQGDRGRVRGSPGADRRAALDSRRPGSHRRPHPRGAARDQGDLRQGRRPAHGDRRGRGGARARGPDRGGGHGHRDHALRLRKAPARDHVPGAAARRASASWAWS